MDKLDLMDAFTSFQRAGDFFKNIVQALDAADPAVAILTLEGLYRIKSDVEGRQFPQLPFHNDSEYQDPTIEIQTRLRRWRCEWPLGDYSRAYFRVPKFLRSLTIFKTFEVPLFIDDYGEKKLLSFFEEKIEDIAINEDTRILHVTHIEEAESIAKEKQFKPSDNKNIIKGCWFGLGLGNSTSVYGSKAFQTTLSQLGVTGLHQGEIVSYKKEVNVILYASAGADTKFEGLKKPTDDAVKEADPEAYVKVSIFVPARFLPETTDDFRRAVSGPTDVKHGPFCVKVKRRIIENCPELQD